MMNVLLPTLFFCTITSQYSAAKTTVDVLILGGGISGITAANHLDNNDVKSFLVLEAQDYFGGRLKNIVVGNTTLSEGANWISFTEQGEFSYGLTGP
jgi:monoamine oxidase